jgi:hypothetical protein
VPAEIIDITKNVTGLPTSSGVIQELTAQLAAAEDRIHDLETELEVVLQELDDWKYRG